MSATSKDFNDGSLFRRLSISEHQCGDDDEAAMLDCFDFGLDAEAEENYEDFLLGEADQGMMMTDREMIDAAEDIISNEIHDFPSYQPRRNQRDRSPSSSNRNQQQRGGVLETSAKEALIARHQQHRQASHGDVSMCSYATAQSSISSSPAASNNQSRQQNFEYQEALRNLAVSMTQSSTSSVACAPNHSKQYNEALRNLTESMKRSEESRRVVNMMKRRHLNDEQRRALYDAKERLRGEMSMSTSQQQQPSDNYMSSHHQQPLQQPSSSNNIVSSLFSGSTGGVLEAGRKCFGTYMGQVNHRTF